MANLDKLLRKIERNKENAEKTTTHQLTIDGETFDVTTFTKAERKQFFYAQEATQKDLLVGDIVKKMKPYIYKALNLKDLAVRAKDEGLINSYYDVIDALFEPDEILEISGFIMDINSISSDDVVNEVEELKKQ